MKLLFMKISMLKGTTTSSLVNKLREGSVPVQQLNNRDVKLWTLVAVLLRHLDAHPRRYKEISPATAPVGAVFVLGHSMEDFHRAYTAWKTFVQIRYTSKKKNYGLQYQQANSTEPHGQEIIFVQSQEAADLARETNTNLTLLPHVHSQMEEAFRTLLHNPKNIPLGPVHLRAMEWVLEQFRPSALQPVSHRNPRLALQSRNIDELNTLIYISVAPQWLEVGGTIEMGRNPKFLMHYLDQVSYTAPKDKDLPLLLKHYSMRFPEESNTAYRALCKTYRAAVLKNPVEHDGSAFWKTAHQAATRALGLCAFDVNNTSLIRPTENICALYLVKERNQNLDRGGRPFMDAVDCGVSFICRLTTKDHRLPTPICRADCVFHLVRNSPILATLVRMVLKYTKHLLVVVEDMWIQQ
jgi:hypothetical protein